jgi:Fe-S cluster biogenesis protein NfuA/nitrite reductase/ring-hydroxylating ferredoxin subunit
MAAAPTDAPERLVERVQELQDLLDVHGDSTTREIADELVSSIVQMYGAGLERIVARLFAGGMDGERIAVGLTEDPLIATLLLIHDLHPVPIEDRVQAALESVRPYMESHGGNVELLSLEDGIARIHLRGSCSDCSASSVTLELAIKQALEEAAPDLAGLEVEGVAPQMTGLALPMSDGAGPTGLELPIVMAPASPALRDRSGGDLAGPPPPPSWFELDSVGELAEGAMMALTVADSELVIANVEGTLLAYRDVCASCGGALHDGTLSGGALACPSCQRSFFLPRAGRSIDAERIQLEPVPLLREQGRVKVALAAAG